MCKKFEAYTLESIQRGLPHRTFSIRGGAILQSAPTGCQRFKVTEDRTAAASGKTLPSTMSIYRWDVSFHQDVSMLPEQRTTTDAGHVCPRSPGRSQQALRDVSAQPLRYSSALLAYYNVCRYQRACERSFFERCNVSVPIL